MIAVLVKPGLYKRQRPIQLGNAKQQNIVLREVV